MNAECVRRTPGKTTPGQDRRRRPRIIRKSIYRPRRAAGILRAAAAAAAAAAASSETSVTSVDRMTSARISQQPQVSCASSSPTDHVNSTRPAAGSVMFTLAGGSTLSSLPARAVVIHIIHAQRTDR